MRHCRMHERPDTHGHEQIQTHKPSLSPTRFFTRPDWPLCLHVYWSINGRAGMLIKLCKDACLRTGWRTVDPNLLFFLSFFFNLFSRCVAPTTSNKGSINGGVSHCNGLHLMSESVLVLCTLRKAVDASRLVANPSENNTVAQQHHTCVNPL